MLAKSRALRAALGVGVALGGAAGCLLVTPLDELPVAAGGASHGGTSTSNKQPGGDTSGASALGGASAGDGGEPMNVAGEPNGSGECRSNADCIRQSADEPYRCRPSDHTCVALKNEACPLAYGDAGDPNAIYFGAFATLNPNKPEDNSIIWAHELARGELSGNNVGGLPDGPNGMPRPLVMIVCNNAGDVVMPGLEHLAKDVQVPAIIATLKPGDLRHGFETYAQQDIFYLSPVSVTSTVVDKKDDGLIWNLLGQPSDMAPTYAELLKLIEKRVRKDRNLQPADQIKVALVTTKDAFDAELANAVTPLLNFNGLDATGNATNFAGFTLDYADPELLTTAIPHTAIDIANYQPDVIISAASELFSMVDGVQEQIETNWATVPAFGPRPFYILSPYNAGNLDQLMTRLNGLIDGGAEADPQQRYVGVSIAGPRDNTLQNSYALRLHTAFKKAIVDTANYYDAIYYLAYAMYAADPSQELTGSSIAQGMQRLLSGKNVNVGPSGINAAFDALATAGATVHINSTLGPPDFDPKTGVRAVDGSVLCFSKMGSTVELHTDVLRYDADKQALTGTFPCFSGFFP